MKTAKAKGLKTHNASLEKTTVKVFHLQMKYRIKLQSFRSGRVSVGPGRKFVKMFRPSFGLRTNFFRNKHFVASYS